MRILLTGAAGFVGKRLVRRLADAGHEVFALARAVPAGADAAYFASPRVHLVVQDLVQLDTTSLPAGIEAVITLAQSSRFREFPGQAEEIFAVNVSANLKLLQWAVASGVGRFVHASSGGIYGGKLGAQFVETDLLAVDSPLGFYLGSKLCAEVVFQNYRQFFRTAVILRPFFVYGPGQRHDMFIARMVESVRTGRAIQLQGEDGLRINPVYVDDAASAFAGALALDGYHIINVAGPDVLTLRAACGIIGRAVGREPVYENKPGNPVDYVGDNTLEKSKLLAELMPFAEGVARTTRG